MNLKLKHFVPYLPYKIKVLMWGKSVDVITGYDLRDYGPGDGLDSERLTVYCDDWGSGNDPEDLKLLLRPLDDLSIPVLIDGRKTIIPSVFPTLLISGNPGFDREIEERIEWIKSKINDGSLQYRFWLRLLEYHFDVFGLIDLGVAIDMKTIKITTVPSELDPDSKP